MKARAERFGVPFNPNPTPRNAPVSNAAASSSKPAPAEDAVPATDSTAPAAKKAKIDSTPLGISEEVLAKRAAKFGLPEKKVEASTAAAPAAVPTEKVEPEVTRWVPRALMFGCES
jgi:hypothetical protein